MSRFPSDGDVLNNWQNALEPELGEIDVLRLRGIEAKRIERRPGFAALVFFPHAPTNFPARRPVAVVGPADELAASLRSALGELTPTEMDDLLAAVRQLASGFHRTESSSHPPSTDAIDGGQSA
ncbi:MAG: hypothetical protein F4003_09660 [Acidimicrobiaceae bacterium]|nr:hypothetical protein [Acidimicrobiaceae bacterium]